MQKLIVISFLLLLSSLISHSQTRKSEGSKTESLKITATAKAQYETQPFDHSTDEDAADDPAIWYNKQNPKKSTIIGTDKKGGLAVYNLKGEKLFYYPDGNMNNVDVRYNFILGKDTIDIACASNRSSHSISIYSVQPDGSLQNIAARKITSDMKDEVYGFAMYKSPISHKTYAFINSKAGEIEQWELLPNNKTKKIDAKKVREFKLGTQVEGMVADDENKVIFIGEEVNGIWKFGAEPNDETTGKLLDKSNTNTNKNIAYDIEGLAIYFLPEGEGYLLASIQGNYSYAVYNRKPPHNYLGSFRLIEGKVDGVEETDGIAIFSYRLNKDFKKGILVVQDGFNSDRSTPMPQNFKLVRWKDISKIFTPRLGKNKHKMHRKIF